MSRKDHQFRPTLSGALEPRIAPGSVAAIRSALPVVTTHTYNDVLEKVDYAFRRFRSSDGEAKDYTRLRDRLAAQVRRLPFGNQELAPLVLDVLDVVNTDNANAVRDAFKGEVRSYLRDNIVDEPNFAWLQSRHRHSSDDDFGPRAGKA